MSPKSRVAKKKEAFIKAKPSSVPAAAGEAARALPNWPLFTALLPAEHLSLHALLHDQILTIPRLWTTSLCRTYINFLATLPLTTTPGKPKRGEAVRVNDRFQVDDAHFAENLWSHTALKNLVKAPSFDGRTLSDDATRELWNGEVLGLNSNIRIYRYTKGQYFDQHYDESNNVMFPSTASPAAVPAKTTWTLLLYLSSPATGCQGGETVFHPDPPNRRDATPPPIVAELEIGTVLLHRHGSECLLHEGREVTAGEKWVIRSDLCVRR